MKLVREKRDRPAAAAGAAMAVADTGVAEKVVSEEATNELANNDSGRVIWAGLDSNQRRRKASRFTVCPVWPLRYLPVNAREFIYPRAPKLATRISFPPDIDGLNQTVSS